MDIFVQIYTNLYKFVQNVESVTLFRSVSVVRMSREEINVHNPLFHLENLYSANISDDREKKKKKKHIYCQSEAKAVRYKCISFVVCVIVLSSTTIWEQSQLNLLKSLISYCKTCIDSDLIQAILYGFVSEFI